MSGHADDWSELQRTWRSTPVPDALELERVRAGIARARRAQVLRTTLDAAACALGLGIGAWSVSSGTGTGIVAGLAAFVFTGFGGWLAWRNARRRRPAVTGTVVEALDAAIALERSAEDWARAVAPMGAAAAAFLGVLVLATAWDPEADPARLRRTLSAVGLALLVLAGGTVAGHWLARRYRRRRRLLEQRRRELEA